MGGLMDGLVKLHEERKMSLKTPRALNMPL